MTKSFSTEIQSVAVLEVNGEIARIVREFVTALIASAVGNDQCNVVVLLAADSFPNDVTDNECKPPLTKI